MFWIKDTLEHKHSNTVPPMWLHSSRALHNIVVRAYEKRVHLCALKNTGHKKAIGSLIGGVGKVTTLLIAVEWFLLFLQPIRSSA